MEMKRDVGIRTEDAVSVHAHLCLELADALLDDGIAKP